MSSKWNVVLFKQKIRLAAKFKENSNFTIWTILKIMSTNKIS